MKLSLKDYRILKTKRYIETNNLGIFADGVSRDSLNWLNIEQGLKKIEFDYYKLSNKTSKKTLYSSIYTNTKSIVSGPTFFIRPNSNKLLLKQTILDNFSSLSFESLLIKFNTKLYSPSVLKNIYTFNYKETKLLLYQFKLTSLKLCSKFSK